MGAIYDDVMGDVWPASQTGSDGANYGSATLSPQGYFEVRTFQHLPSSIIYTVGDYGLDDPSAMNYTNPCASNGVAL